MTLVKSLYSDDPNVIRNTWNLAYFLVQFMCVHVCSCNTCDGGSHVTALIPRCKLYAFLHTTVCIMYSILICKLHPCTSIYWLLLKIMKWKTQNKDGIIKLFKIPGIDSASLCSLTGQHDNPIPTRFLAPHTVDSPFPSWQLLSDKHEANTNEENIVSTSLNGISTDQSPSL
jgi:hypothetical protein